MKKQSPGVLECTKKTTAQVPIQGTKISGMLGAPNVPEKSSKTAIASSVDKKNETDPEKVQGKVFPIHDNKPVCTSPLLGRPIGLKRTICSADSRKKKRSCRETQKKYKDINTAVVQELDPSISIDDANAILRDYNHAVKILKLQKTTGDDATPSLEYMIQLINEWKPRREIICMYVRWSKRLRRNYHLDSISTLLCVANQCDYTPHVFLKNIKTLTISCSTTTYGLNFKFDTCKNKAIDGNKLNEKFLGLSITLRLLQSGIVSGAGTFGNIGLKTSQNRNESIDDILMTTGESPKKYVVAHQPTSRFHTNGGLLGRIWLAIQHRWIAIQIVEMLFPAQLAHAKTEQESLAFSFQMHASAGPTRYDFLDPLIGVCLRFRTTTIIDTHADILGNVWDKPRSFVAFGNAYLQGTTDKDRIRYVAETFNDLKLMMKSRKKITMHMKTEREAKWQMVRGYAFHFWLERVKNQKLKEAINGQCTTSVEQRSPPKKESKTHCAKKHTETFTTTTVPFCNTIVGTKKSETTLSGLLPLLKTRQVCPHPLKTPQPLTGPQEVLLQESHSSNTGPEQPTKSIDLNLFVWTSLRLASKLDVTSLVSSHFLIHRDDGIDMTAELSPLEVYSADMLYKLRHSRRTGQQGFFPRSEIGSVVLSIGADVDKFVDQSSKIYHVAREDSNYFQEHGYLIPQVQQIIQLCRAVVKYGKHDVSRCSQQYRVNIGCGGQHRPNGKPETLVGLSFKASLVSDTEFNAEEILATIGSMTEFTWNVLNDMQVDARDGPLAPDQVRHAEYARHLSNYLKANDNVGFEDVTVAVGILYPSMPNCAEHIDSMNDSVAGYTRTGVFNIVPASEQDMDPVLLHVQVICNFRRVIREYVLPFNSLLSSITVNCKHYLAKWQNNMNQVYGGKAPLLPTPFDRANFFVDDCLPFETIKISSACRDQELPITGEYLLTEISPSRVLSFSMFIDPIVDLKEILCYDQRIELCFVASMLSNPFWFEHTITSLTRKHLDNGNSFCFGIHPLYDWARETTLIFGAWQGGPHNRWSPCGGGAPFPNLFGANADATDQERMEGKSKLESIIQVLYHHLQWVNSLEQSATVADLTLSTIENHMTSVTAAVFQVVPCQFNVFRLLVFTTLIAGCGDIKQGSHLKALMYPVKGSASFKHLARPNQDQMTRKQALSLCTQQENLSNVYNEKNEGVQSQRHDDLMLYLSNAIGMPRYLRDETECVLCEGHPNRNLQCRDWFKKGRRLYDCDMEGNVLQKEYGISSHWVKMEPPTRVKFAFLKEVIIYQQIDEVLKDYAMVFGEVLRKNKGAVKFCGRSTKTSDYIQHYINEYTANLWKEPFSVIRHRAANFYFGDYTRQMNITTIQVLGDGELPTILDPGCNDITIFPDGLRLWKHVLYMIFGTTDEHGMYSARYHQQQESFHESKTVFFPGHLDKAFVKAAIFLPLTVREFYTIIGVPKSWYTKQNEDSYAKFKDWTQRIPVHEKKMIDDFLLRFLLIAEKFMKIDVEMRVFLSTVGSLLVFPANICFHTTLTPGYTLHSKDPRDLFIIHPTATTKR